MKFQQPESNQGTQICLFYMQLKGKAKLQNCHINSVTMPLQLWMICNTLYNICWNKALYFIFHVPNLNFFFFFWPGDQKLK